MMMCVLILNYSVIGELNFDSNWEEFFGQMWGVKTVTKIKNRKKKIPRETLNLSTDADRSNDTIFVG